MWVAAVYFKPRMGVINILLDKPQYLVVILIVACLALLTYAPPLVYYKKNAVAVIGTRLGLIDLALKLNSDADIALKIGNYYLNGGAYDLNRAKKAYERVLAIHPNTPSAHYQISRIYFLREEGVINEIKTAFYKTNSMYVFSIRELEEKRQKIYDVLIERFANKTSRAT